MQLVPIPPDGSINLSGLTLSAAATNTIAATVQLYEQRGRVEPWVGYLAIEGGNCVGCCGFTSAPVGEVAEIAYFTYPDFERRGFATRMAQGLIAIAENCDSSVRLMAHTLAEENASTHILKKLGFAIIGTIDDPEDGKIWEWSYGSKHDPA